MIPIVEKFPKSVFSLADVERERALRLQIDGVLSSVITEEAKLYILTTTFPAQDASSAGAGTGPKTPAAAVLKYESLVAGGFFSSEPNDHTVPRAIRTNNPGALNISAWQRKRKGFAGVTESDGSANRNKTTIYRTPEHGVAAWFHLLSVLYKLGSKPSFGLKELAQRYAGADAGSAVENYMKGWIAASGDKLTATSKLNLNDGVDSLLLARSMFAHEAGKLSPVHDDQIEYGIAHEKDGTLPA